MLGYPFPRNPSTNRKKWIFPALLIIHLLLCGISSAAEVRWRQEFRAKIDGQVMDCAFAGGMEFSKPAFVDIDADGDLDLFVGDEDGLIRFFRNRGLPHSPQWELVSEFYDSTIGERSCPTFADIDDDGDWDLFVGNRSGRICFFRNDGNANSPVWIQVSDFYDSIDVGSESVPFLVDIDSDSDSDLFVGKEDGTLSFYRNVGTKEIPVWSLVCENYDSIDVGAKSAPAFVDLDADGDFDLLSGEEQGNVNLYRNTGDEAAPLWELVSINYNSIDAGKRSCPAFVDIDDDSDPDLFVGQDEGKIFYFRNDGSAYLPSWTPVAENYLFIDFGAHSAPALADIDGDGDADLFAGEYEGNLNFYQNEKTLSVSSWSKVSENYFAIEADDYSSPTFADIDGDGDLDLFTGRKDGKVEFYLNIGSAESALWNPKPDAYDFIDAGGYACPALADIDNDADLDLFVGQTYGKIYFYRNDGTPQIPSWTEVSENFESIDVGWYSTPTFGDLDLDGDPDLLVGNDEGKVWFHRNEGTPDVFSFVFVTDYFDSIKVTKRSTPVLHDFDSDGDLDLFVGESKGGLHYYGNLTLNSIRGRVSDQAIPLENVAVYLSGDREDSTLTDSSGNYRFVGLPIGDYCVFLDPASLQYCFSPLNSDTFEIDFHGVTQVGDFSEENIPECFRLFPNYPNPFNPLTNIVYFLPADVRIKLTVYNLKGEKVRELIDGFQTKGWKKVIWDGKDSRGRSVSSGIYFCELQADQASETMKMVLLK
jgi:hypothetical protein